MNSLMSALLHARQLSIWLSLVRGSEEHARAVHFEPDGNLLQVPEVLSNVGMAIWRDNHQQEAAAAGAAQFAAERAGFERAVIPAIDLARRDRAGQAAL